MPNMSPKKVAMPEQPAEVRNRNFEEVALGYSEDHAREEADRCLGCKHAPCVKGCPVGVQIPQFIECIKQGDFEKAYATIAHTNSLPAVCGRVCPQENQCEKLCVRAIKGEPVGIGRLERFAADRHIQNSQKTTPPVRKNGHKVAVIGSGPASLSCAGDLAKLGYGVTVFEALHEAGGVLTYGIPEFRLPKDIVRQEIDTLKEWGVELQTNMVIGKVLSIDELFDMGYEAVFIGVGAGLPKFMGIPGEGLCGVYSANEYLTRINLMKSYLYDADTPINKSRSVAVVGGGNVAMDVARCAKRLGAEQVHIIYRRGEKELPARAEEVHHAKEEGIIFDLLTNPVRITGDERGNVTGIECIRMELGEPDASGRRSPVEIEGSQFIIDTDTVVMSIGTGSSPLLTHATPGLELNRYGGIIADENGMTSREGVFAGGDIVTGAATVILAMGAGKKAAQAMDQYIQSKR